MYNLQFTIRVGKWFEGANLPYDVLNACAVATHQGVIVLGDFGPDAGTNAYLLANGTQWVPLQVLISIYILYDL